VRRLLANRTDILCTFARAHGIRPGDPPARGDDYIVVGRPKLIASSYRAARRLEGGMYGEFVDSPTGSSGDTIWYGGRRFTQHEIAQSTPEWRRYDRDYGVFMYREEDFGGEERRLAALAGLGSLGTLLLTASLAHPPLCAQLARQANAIAPLTPLHQPNVRVEVLVGFTLHEPAHVDGLVPRLNDVLELGRRQSLADIFSATVEAVAVCGGDGKKQVFLNELPGIQLDLRPRDGGRGGGLLQRLDTGRTITVSPDRFDLLRALADHPDPPIDALCRVLARKRGTLRKLVSDLNDDLEPFLGARPVRCDRKVKRVVCDGVRVVWRPDE
jgi:hypothetical protein